MTLSCVKSQILMDELSRVNIKKEVKRKTTSLKNDKAHGARHTGFPNMSVRADSTVLNRHGLY